MNSKLLLAAVTLLLFFVSCSFAQKPIDCGQNDKAFIEKLIKELDPDNELRMALERGGRGDCKHAAYMDVMRELGVKQVSVIVDFRWHNDQLQNFTPREINYHPVYYMYSVVIQDQKKLQEIRTKLEPMIKAEAAAEAKRFMTVILDGRPGTDGTAYLNFLDDERLPVLYEMPVLGRYDTK